MLVESKSLVNRMNSRWNQLDPNKLTKVVPLNSINFRCKLDRTTLKSHKLRLLKRSSWRSWVTWARKEDNPQQIAVSYQLIFRISFEIYNWTKKLTRSLKTLTIPNWRTPLETAAFTIHSWRRDLGTTASSLLRRSKVAYSLILWHLQIRFWSLNRANKECLDLITPLNLTIVWGI